MRTFPENRYDGDVTGRGTIADLSKEIVRRKSRYVEIKTLVNEEFGFKAGTFGQFQFHSDHDLTMSVRFMGDGQGGGHEMDGIYRSTMKSDFPVEWVIHPELE